MNTITTSPGASDTIRDLNASIDRSAKIIATVLGQILDLLKQDSPDKALLRNHLDQLSREFQCHKNEAPEQRDIRLKASLGKISREQGDIWSIPRSRMVITVSKEGGRDETVIESPITLDEILALPPIEKQRELRLLLVYGVTSQRISEIFKKK